MASPLSHGHVTFLTDTVRLAVIHTGQFSQELPLAGRLGKYAGNISTGGDMGRLHAHTTRYPISNRSSHGSYRWRAVSQSHSRRTLVGGVVCWSRARLCRTANRDHWNRNSFLYSKRAIRRDQEQR